MDNEIIVPKPVKSKNYNYNPNIRSRLGFEQLSSSKKLNSYNFRSFEKRSNKDSDIFVSNFEKEIEEDFDLIKVKSEIFSIIGHHCDAYSSNEYQKSILDTAENEETISPVRSKNPFSKNNILDKEEVETKKN
jgi:hypothetical protein